MKVSNALKYSITSIVFFTTMILYFFVFEEYSYQKKFTLIIGGVILLALNYLWNREEQSKYRLIYRIVLYSTLLILALSSLLGA